jgi:GTPase SAR1 family protein
MDSAASTNTTSTASAAEVIRTKILLTGLRKCGKTSIQEVLFKGLSPKDAFFIEPTTKVVKTAYESVVPSNVDSAWTFKNDTSSTVIPLEIWDCPGSLTIQTLPTPLSQFPTIVFVIDIQVRLFYDSWDTADHVFNRIITNSRLRVWWNWLSPLIRRIRM